MGRGCPRYSGRVLKRVWLPLVTLFWVAMNALLWRAEMAARSDGGSPVSPDLVWDRMLTAPDESALEIRHAGRKVGWVRWIPRIEEEPPAEAAERELPEGRVERVTGYTIVLDGSVAVPDTDQRYRFSGQLSFDPARQWRALSLRVTRRPQVWEVRADLREQALTFRWGEEPGGWEQRFTFAELANPEALLAALGLPLPGGWLRALFPALNPGQARPAALGLSWDTRSDWLPLGSARTRIFRVRAQVLDRHEVVLVLSRVGEIFRLDLPGRLTLVNDAVAGFAFRP